ncbi:ORF195 [White spot syndrome virus]|uniref:ORF195 n=1 Tax=White spot syndrome virus TaxID=342409 RepID=A0A2D3I601_9VIRU|nr:ORF195 [White spot syndrome virus]
MCPFCLIFCRQIPVVLPFLQQEVFQVLQNPFLNNPHSPLKTRKRMCIWAARFLWCTYYYSNLEKRTFFSLLFRTRRIGRSYVS